MPLALGAWKMLLISWFVKESYLSYVLDYKEQVFNLKCTRKGPNHLHRMKHLSDLGYFTKNIIQLKVQGFPFPKRLMSNKWQCPKHPMYFEVDL